jgi:hypothetical protein
MAGTPGAEALPEPARNDLLRRVDWRFLLRERERPRCLDLSSGRTSEAVRLISDPAGAAPGAADVVTLGFPRRRPLAAARDALRDGGEIVCTWDVPVPGGALLARRALLRAGFSEVRLYWPGPLRRGTPKFWLALDSDAAASHLLTRRPAQSATQALLRPIWRLARRLGVLAPVWALARAPGGGSQPGDDRTEGLDADGPWLLLTEGGRSINKVVGLPFAGEAERPETVVKFARVPEGDEALEREAGVLRILERERPAVAGIPRVVAEGRRCGRRALAETAIQGLPLSRTLSAATFPDLAAKLTGWLVGLAGHEQPQAPGQWWARLIDEPLANLERQFGAVLEPGSIELARELLEGLGPMPPVCEHRDCSPWNVLLTAGGEPALLDWESAEPRGLPGLDLVYFLSNSVFRMENAYEKERARESYSRLLDPTTPEGEVASRSLREYCAGVGLGEESLAPLRLLCWIVHSRSDYRHLEMEAAGPPTPGALSRAMFPGLVEEELRLAQRAG